MLSRGNILVFCFAVVIQYATPTTSLSLSPTPSETSVSMHTTSHYDPSPATTPKITASQSSITNGKIYIVTSLGTVKALLGSPRRGLLNPAQSRGELISEGCFFTKSNNKDKKDSILDLLNHIFRIQPTLLRVKYRMST